MSEFVAFEDRVFEKPGFYILRRKDGTEFPVYCGTPERHYGRCYSFPVTLENDKYPAISHDIGYYCWVNHVSDWFSQVRVDAWRPMTTVEEVEFRTKLYRFDRPSRLKEWEAVNRLRA